MYVTFDSNVWRAACDPSRFPRDPAHAAFLDIHEALRSQQLRGRLSETVFTLEGIRRLDRKDFLATYMPRINFVEREEPGGNFSLEMTIGPDPRSHPGSHPILTSHLQDALGLDFQIMRSFRVAASKNPDIQEEWFVPTESGEVSERCGAISREIEARGAGIAVVKEIGKTWASPGQIWYEALANADPSEDRRIAAAVAEWADADSVSAHVAYGNQYFCTRDHGVSAGDQSVLSPHNREWLRQTYDVEFVNPVQLASLL